jgi:dihydrofolate reductase
MRQLILQEFVTLDGLAAGPGGSVDYVPAAMRGDTQFGAGQVTLMESVDAILLGRVTYQMFAGHWPNVTDPDEKPFADRINAIPKVVFSRTLARAPWGTFADARVVRKNAVDEVRSLKQQPGKSMVIWGSISLAQSLMAASLIDEYRLVVCPVALGEGRPLFSDSDQKIHFTLKEATTHVQGVTLTYVPRR